MSGENKQIKVLTAETGMDGFSCCTVSEAGAGFITTETVQRKIKHIHLLTGFTSLHVHTCKHAQKYKLFL